MHILWQILLILLGCAALWKGAQWIVDSAARIAKWLGISELVIGLTVVAFGTSAPEFAVTVGAAVSGQEGIPVANIVGSNIFNIGIILGICAIFMTINVSRELIRRDGPVLLGTTILLLAMMWDHHLSQLEGIILIALLIVYILFLFWKRQAVIDEDIAAGKASWRDGPMLITGLALVVIGGKLLVTGAVELAQLAGISSWVIGLTVVAAGTSLPELVISMVALMKKYHGISAGNLIGSNIFNTLGVLGVAAAIKPLSVDNTAIISMAAQVGITLVVCVMMWRLKRFSKVQGVILIILSLLIWAYNFMQTPVS